MLSRSRFSTRLSNPQPSKPQLSTKEMRAKLRIIKLEIREISKNLEIAEPENVRQLQHKCAINIYNMYMRSIATLSKKHILSNLLWTPYFPYNLKR